MKFKFNLETLLKHRKREEEEAMREFAEAQSILQGHLDALKALYSEVDGSFKMREEIRARHGKMSRQLQSYDEYIEGLEIKIDRKKAEVRDQKMIVEEKQALLAEAAKEYKIIDRLKEKQFERFKKAAKVKEVKEIDDIVIMRHGWGGS